MCVKSEAGCNNETNIVLCIERIKAKIILITG